MITWLHAHWWIGYSIAFPLGVWALIECIRSDYATALRREMQQVEQDAVDAFAAIRPVSGPLPQSAQDKIAEIKEAERIMMNLVGRDSQSWLKQ